MNDDQFRALREDDGKDGGAAADAGCLPALVGTEPFIAAQFMVAVGSVDAEGAAWTSLLFGKPGFVRSSDGAAIRIDMPLKERDLADPAWENIAVGAELGLLFVDLATRQRCRVDGIVQRLDRRGAEIAVREAGANWLRHGARRALRELGEPRLPVQTAHGSLVRGAIERIVSRADSLFLARRAQAVEVSHHGAGTGFVTLAGPGTLRIAYAGGDQPGASPGRAWDLGRAGICIPDFHHGQVLQLTGHAHREESGAGGRRQHWEFEVERWILRDMPRALAWEAA